MKIEILGDGCSKCSLLKTKVQQALDELDLKFEIISVNEPERLTELHTLSLPQLVINDQLSSTRTTMSVEEIKDYIGTIDE